MEPEKKPRHIVVAVNHLLKQRQKAIDIRDKTAKEVEELEAALKSLGWEG